MELFGQWQFLLFHQSRNILSNWPLMQLSRLYDDNLYHTIILYNSCNHMYIEPLPFPPANIYQGFHCLIPSLILSLLFPSIWFVFSKHNYPLCLLSKDADTKEWEARDNAHKRFARLACNSKLEDGKSRLSLNLNLFPMM